jgi:hypothetical protein
MTTAWLFPDARDFVRPRPSRNMGTSPRVSRLRAARMRAGILRSPSDLIANCVENTQEQGVRCRKMGHSYGSRSN